MVREKRNISKRKCFFVGQRRQTAGARDGIPAHLLKSCQGGPGAQEIRAVDDGLAQLGFGFGRVVETEIAQARQVVRVGRSCLRRLRPATASAAAPAAAAAGGGGRSSQAG